MRISSPVRSIILSAALALGSALPSYGISIIWNYDYDTSEFFTEERRLVLAKAAERFNHVSIASPDLPHPTEEGDYWNWEIVDPVTGDPIDSIPGNLQAGTLTIYVGAANLGGTVLGRGGPLGSDAYATDEWIDVLESLSTPEVFKPYAGILSITNSSAYTWYSGLSDAIPNGEVDLYSVVLHELGHIFGIGTSQAWYADISGGYFVGEHVTALVGEGLQVSLDGAHFENGVWNGVPLLMNSGIVSGQRYDWSALEDAVLMDLGYVVIPEPGTIGFAVAGFGVLWLSRRRLRA